MKSLSVLLIFLLLLSGCERIELPGDRADEGSNGSSPILPDYDGDTLNVAQAQNCPADTLILLKGYIVGYIEGNSIKSGSTFGVPAASANSNMLLADSPNETNYLACVPVKLDNSTSYGFRADLNLYDHPENYQRPIVLLGWLGAYFRTIGVTRVADFQWLGVGAGTFPETPGEEPEETPGLDENEEILQGR